MSPGGQRKRGGGQRFDRRVKHVWARSLRLTSSTLGTRRPRRRKGTTARGIKSESDQDRGLCPVVGLYSMHVAAI